MGQPESRKKSISMENKVEEIVSMLAESLNDRKVAVENFGNAKKNIDGKTLKLLARNYKDAYQKWIDVLSEVDDVLLGTIILTQCKNS